MLLFLYGKFSDFLFIDSCNGVVVFYFIFIIWREDWFWNYCVNGYGNFLGVDVK